MRRLAVRAPSDMASRMLRVDGPFPAPETFAELCDVVGRQAMVSECLIRDASESRQSHGEHGLVEARISVSGESAQIVHGVTATAQHRVNVNEVADFGSAVEGGHLVRDRVVLVQNRADLQPDR